MPNNLEEPIEVKRSTIFTEDGYCIGFVKAILYTEDRRVLDLEYKISEEDFRGHGYGKKAVKRFINQLRQDGYKNLLNATVEAENIASIKILEACGFLRLASFENTHNYILHFNQSAEEMRNAINLTNKQLNNL